jgi:hypothetical protein
MSADNSNKEVMSSSTTLEAALPFVIVGPGGAHRRVLVRSVTATLDLSGLDGLPDEAILHRNSGLGWIQLNFGDRAVTQRNIVRSDETISTGPEDGRNTHYSFAWKGLSTSNDRRKIEGYFREVSKDLEMALKVEARADIEMVLAPLILMCEDISERRIRLRTTSKNLGVITIILYVLLGIAAFATMRAQRVNDIVSAAVRSVSSSPQNEMPPAQKQP